MVQEGDIVVSIWDLVGEDEYHAIKWCPTLVMY
jgi:hypothetical protein